MTTPYIPPEDKLIGERFTGPIPTRLEDRSTPRPHYIGFCEAYVPSAHTGGLDDGNEAYQRAIEAMANIPSDRRLTCGGFIDADGRLRDDPP